MPDTVLAYEEVITTQLARADLCIGLFGMGMDGHTAGILPNSPAVSSSTLVRGYDAGRFLRITITPAAIRMLHEAVLYAVGVEKRQPLLDLVTTELSIAAQPAQALKSSQKLHIFTDQHIQVQ
jgi:6-phosphogluconolactonase/glucosamine-6-phosphate isomerase/deaminase